MNTVICKYLKSRKRGRYGLVLVKKNDKQDGNLCIGWSLCNKADKFDKNLGYILATDRASRVHSLSLEDFLYEYNKDLLENAFFSKAFLEIPSSLRKEMFKICVRAAKIKGF